VNLVARWSSGYFDEFGGEVYFVFDDRVEVFG